MKKRNSLVGSLLAGAFVMSDGIGWQGLPPRYKGNELDIDKEDLDLLNKYETEKEEKALAKRDRKVRAKLTKVGYYTKDGLIWFKPKYKDDYMLSACAADAVAKGYGFQYAEQLVAFMEGKLHYTGTL